MIPRVLKLRTTVVVLWLVVCYHVDPSNRIGSRLQGIGSGSFGDPLTLAAASNGPFKKCEVVYLPYLKKYARFEDVCGQCRRSPLCVTQSVGA